MKYHELKRYKYIAWLVISMQIGMPVSVAYSGVVNVNKTQNHTLQAGETAWTVASEFGLTAHELQSLNRHRQFPGGFDNITTGDVVNIPASGVNNKNVPGDKPPSKNNEYTLAANLSQAANLLNNASADAQKNQALGLASSAASGAVQAWFNQFGTARIQLSLDKDFNANGSSADMLIPVYDNKNSMLFTQLGFRNKDERNTLNIGAGVRHFQGGWMYGGNVFLDNDLTGNNRRVGLGAEAWTDYLKLSGNYYFGLTDWHQSRDLAEYNERPANGYDLRAEGYLPAYPQLGAKLMYEKYFGEEVALFSYNDRKKNPHAVTAGMSYTPFPLLTVGAEHRAGSSGANDSAVNLQFTVRPGSSWNEHLRADAVAASRTLAGTRTDLVERNNTIVLDYQKQELIKLSLPTRLTGSVQDTLTVQAQVKSTHGLQRIDWQAPQLIADGGSFKVTGPQTLSITLPSKASSMPYVLSAVAQDNRNNRSNRAVTHITVIEAGISATYDKKVSPVILAANSNSTSNITVTLIDSNGQAITGQAGSLISTISGKVIKSGTVRSMATLSQQIKEPVIGEYKETSPGVYNAVLTVGSYPGEFIISTTWPGTDVFKSYTSIAQIIFTNMNIGTPIVTGDGSVADGNNNATVTFPITDSSGQPAAGQTVDITITLPDGSTSSQQVVTDANGNATVDIGSDQPGIINITGSVGGSSQTADVNLVSTNITIANVTVLQNNASVTGAGATNNPIKTNRVRVLVVDENGNAQPGKVVRINAAKGASVSSPAMTDVNGQAEFDITSTRGGVETLTAIIPGSYRLSADVIFFSRTQLAPGSVCTLTVSGSASMNLSKAATYTFDIGLVSRADSNVSVGVASSSVIAGMRQLGAPTGWPTVGVVNKGAAANGRITGTVNMGSPIFTHPSFTGISVPEVIFFATIVPSEVGFEGINMTSDQGCIVSQAFNP